MLQNNLSLLGFDLKTYRNKIMFFVILIGNTFLLVV
jgi:hypothetical protein